MTSKTAGKSLGCACAFDNVDEIRNSLLYPQAWHKTSEMLQRARREFGKQGQAFLISDLSKAIMGEKEICPTTGKFSNETKGDVMEFNVTDDELMLFAGVCHRAVDGSWTDIKMAFEVNRAKRGIRAEQSIRWSDLEQLPVFDKVTRLFVDAKALGQLDMLVEALSRRHVPVHRSFVARFKVKETAILDLPPPFLNKVCVACTRSWEDIAWHMGYRNSNDRLCFGQSKIPMQEVFADHWAQNGKKITVNEFIDVLSRTDPRRNDIIAMLKSAPLTTTTAPTSSSSPCLMTTTAASNPLAMVIASQQRQVVTTQSFLQDSSNALRNALLLAMDETEAWFALLAAKNLLHGPQMEAWVAGMRKNWAASRGNEPSLQVVRNLCEHDGEFARGTLVDLANLLNQLKIARVTEAVSRAVEFYETKTNKTMEKSTTAFSAQGELRAWLVSNNVCDEGEVDDIVVKLRKEGVECVDHFRGFDKDDLKEIGFTTRQAIAIGKKLGSK